mmetsp:Transcript_38588/g.101800  ORF Transcript_38588/g.101800 Transcript_38588/m.101800 type:complete len:146 (+) Transcript_38588:3-440(+)
MFLAKMDPEVWQSILRGSVAEEVTEAEFICGILVSLELVPQADIEVLKKLWGKHAKDDRIRRQELAGIARSYRSRGSSVADLHARRKSIMSTALTKAALAKTSIGAGSCPPGKSSDGQPSSSANVTLTLSKDSLASSAQPTGGAV